MGKFPRVVVPGIAHHVTQRGTRREPTFFEQADYELYVRILREQSERYRVDVWAWCLMPNHAHLVVVPRPGGALQMMMAETHRRYAKWLNQRMGWRGHLWQGPFYSSVMDERYTLAALRYVELNPVTAGIVERAQDYPWSSARAHVLGGCDPLAVRVPFLERIGDWAAFLRTPLSDEEREMVRAHERSGRPLGGEGFVADVEEKLGRSVKPGRPGRPAN